MSSSPDPLAAAIAHHQAGRLAEAEKIYRHILSQNPRNPDVLNLIGTLLGQKGDLVGAENLIRQSLQIHPANAAAYLNLGEFLRRSGRTAEALSTLVEALRYRPSAPAFDNIAAALWDLKCPEAAVDALKLALKFDPNYVIALLKLGIAQAQLGNIPDAMSFFDRAAAIQPQWTEIQRQRQLALSQTRPSTLPRLSLSEISDPRVCVALCAAHTHLHRYDDAIAAASRAIELSPHLTDPLVNLGWLYSLVGRLDDAADACQRAIAIKPDETAANLNLGVIRLLQGDFARGWPLYEYRKNAPGFPYAKFPQPPWDGQPLHGRRILLWFEQGLGDTIQFLRFLPAVENLGGKIHLAVQPELRRIVEHSVKVERFLDPAKDRIEVDVQASLLSLPFLLGVTLQTIPALPQYLHPPLDTIRTWGERITPYKDRLRIGLSWAGRPGHINDANRSMRLGDLAPLASTGAAFFSLQKWKTGFSDQQISAASSKPTLPLIDWTPDLTDLADSAALISHLDLVISVDSAMAHLSAALGKPTWVLLPKAPDWRWLLDREDSPWYPAIRLFRQEKLGDWTSVLTRVVSAIPKLKRTNATIPD